MKTSEISQLDYAPPRRTRGRWIKRVFLAFLVLSNLYFAYEKWGEGVKLQVRMLVAQRRCMGYSQPPTRIVFDTDPSRTTVLLSQGYGQPQNLFASGNFKTIAFFPAMEDAFDAFETASSNLDSWRNAPAPNAGPMGGSSRFADPSSGSAVFLHERRSASGHVRLIQSSVSVSADGGSSGNSTDYSIQLIASALEPASLTGLRKWCEPNLPSKPLPLLEPGNQHWVRLFAGQPDPENASRFMIRYETTNGTGSIEGTLADDDIVQLRIVSGPLPDLLLGPMSAPTNAGN